MTNEEWALSTSAPAMLEGLYLQDPDNFKTLVPTLHRYFLACCWKIKHLIPQKGLRNGLVGAENWIDGLITYEEFHDLEWHAEAEAFAFEYRSDLEDEEYQEYLAGPDHQETVNEIKALIASIKELDGMPYEQARQLLMDAAYFTDSAMVYPTITPAPFDQLLCTSKFLCPDLLRQYIQPTFEGEPKAKSTKDGQTVWRCSNPDHDHSKPAGNS